MDGIGGSRPNGGHLIPPPRFHRSDPASQMKVLDKICSQRTDEKHFALASRIKHNIPIYNAADLDVEDSTLQDEWNHVLLSGAGVFVLQNMYPERSIIDSANAAFSSIIAREKSQTKGDHFSAGQNDRIWNSFSKHCLEDPKSFVEYYSNPWLAKVCEAWLGPMYRITAQVNIVKPGGRAQTSHRDYHLGFQTEAVCAKFPKAMQIASQLLTLQGAIAHTDMPLESGPTRFLPFSQTMEEGFLVYRRSEFAEFFENNYVSLPLRVGDGVFFNPALMHAAGSNDTKDFDRAANLLQVSSAFGKPMESIDSIPLVEACWSHVSDIFARERWSERMRSFVCALAEGYPFPTNLDWRPPAPGGMAPESEQQVVKRALEDKWTKEEVVDALQQMRRDSQ